MLHNFNLIFVIQETSDLFHNYMGVTLLVNQLLVIRIKQYWHSKIAAVFKLVLQYGNSIVITGNLAFTVYVYVHVFLCTYFL